jgi:hypothetical protein
MSGTISINVSGTSIWLNPGQSYALTGSNNVIYCETGCSFTLVGNGDAVILQGTICGTSELVNVAGAGDALGISNSGSAADLISLAGTGDTVGLIAGANFTVQNDVGGQVVFIASNVSANVTGAGGGIYLGGSGDTVTASNQTVGTAAND